MLSRAPPVYTIAIIQYAGCDFTNGFQVLSLVSPQDNDRYRAILVEQCLQVLEVLLLRPVRGSHSLYNMLDIMC